MITPPEPFIKTQIGSYNIFLCHPGGLVEKQEKPIHRYIKNPIYKNPNYINS